MGAIDLLRHWESISGKQYHGISSEEVIAHGRKYGYDAAVIDFNLYGMMGGAAAPGGMNYLNGGNTQEFTDRPDQGKVSIDGLMLSPTQSEWVFENGSMMTSILWNKSSSGNALLDGHIAIHMQKNNIAYNYQNGKYGMIIERPSAGLGGDATTQWTYRTEKSIKPVKDAFRVMANRNANFGGWALKAPSGPLLAQNGGDNSKWYKEDKNSGVRSLAVGTTAYSAEELAKNGYWVGKTSKGKYRLYNWNAFKTNQFTTKTSVSAVMKKAGIIGLFINTTADGANVLSGDMSFSQFSINTSIGVISVINPEVGGGLLILGASEVMFNLGVMFWESPTGRSIRNDIIRMGQQQNYVPNNSYNKP